MAITKRIVCLANSRKLQGRCVAGVELRDRQPSGWIRPVSAREYQEVSEYERQYRDGSDPKLLDIIDVPLLAHRPTDCQRENWLLDPESYWDKVGVFEWAGLQEFAETGGTLWRNGNSTYNGINDQISVELAAQETSSLKLVFVRGLQLRVFAPGAAFGNSKRRVQARFTFAGCNYAFWVTDPPIERTYLAMDNGHYQFGECYLTVSLGEPFQEHCHKLVAAVLEKQQ